MTEQDIAAVPLQVPGPGSVLVPDEGMAGSRIKRLRAFIHAAEQMLAAEVREQFPELDGKTPVFYGGWLVGSEKSEVEVEDKTGDLFKHDEVQGALHPM